MLALLLTLTLPPSPLTDNGSGGGELATRVRPVLARACFACHGPDEAARQAGLRLDLPEAEELLAPGNPAGSELLRRVRSTDPSLRMPPPESGHALEPDEILLLEEWIDSGAPHAAHWAFVPPARPSVPGSGDSAVHPVDAFVNARLRESGLDPAPLADRYALARRLSLDLVGLPPRPEDVRRFVEDAAPDAYERYVERLLGSPAYAERWARVWLDQARYADSAGYGSDPLRTIWRWRDWVIEAYDRNLPYDEFTRLQLAGDLVKEASTDSRLATAFHRNTMTNTEGGTDDEEFRVEAIKDRTNTTLGVWMGLTGGCAECHSHKFDPITQEEYYGLFAFFNQTVDSDRPDEHPRLATPSRAQSEELERLESELATAREALGAPDPGELDRFREWLLDRRTARTREQRLAPSSLESTQGSYALGDEGLVVLSDAGSPPERTVIDLEVELPAGNWTGLGLDLFTSDDLPRGGPGLAGGNFVLTELTVERPASGVAPQARRVRVDLPGANRILSLAEVEVLSGGVNVALEGEASQSSVAYSGPAGLAIDGNTDGDHSKGSVTHTATEPDPWWEVDLGRSVPLDRIVLHNRLGGSLHRRLDGAVVSLFDGDGAVLWRSRLEVGATEPMAFVPAEEPSRLGLFGASASFAQEGFPASAAIDGTDSGQGGWAVSPGQGSSHRITFDLERPLEAVEGTPLRIRLVHAYGSSHVLGRFALFINDHPSPPRALPRELELALVESGTEAGTGADPDPDTAPDTASDTASDTGPVTGPDPGLLDHFRTTDPHREDQRHEVSRIRAAIDGMDVVTTPVLEELPASSRRTTHVLLRGNFLQKGAVVEAGVPESLHPWPEGAPKNRLGLAEWILDPANPLTARVAVNRVWATLFGAGLVETEEDFGNQGTAPTHPQLLDWLAVEFMEGGWDHKELLRTLVTSETYRRSSRVTPEDLLVDPDNRLLARSSRYRLEAEVVRDQALAISGLLSDVRFGPPVFPPQPDGLWRAAFNGQRNWRTSQGEDRHRRAIYTFWRRTIPYPSMEIFDAPSREVCSPRRFRTNTPLQAFVTLNDPVYVEAAQALGRRMLEAGEDDATRAHEGLLRALGRPPAPAEVAEVVGLVEGARELLAGEDPGGVRALAEDPLGPLPEGLQPLEAAAWTAAANVLLNLDAVLTRS